MSNPNSPPLIVIHVVAQNDAPAAKMSARFEGLTAYQCGAALGVAFNACESLMKQFFEEMEKCPNAAVEKAAAARGVASYMTGDQLVAEQKSAAACSFDAPLTPAAVAHVEAMRAADGFEHEVASPADPAKG